MNKYASTQLALPKAPSGIQGLDEITGGGLPRGRPTLVCGAAGCGKTLLALEFLLHGARELGEPGVFLSFEESREDLEQNAASLGIPLKELVTQKQLVVDFVLIDRSEIEETGQYDLEGLFIRISHAVDSIGAKRVVLDTLETLFAGLSNEMILRAELRRLFRWLKGRGLTAVITGESGRTGLTRHGLEEYISDCVILLDHRVEAQLSTRRLRVVKYRGSTHGTNEYPFLIDEHGITVMPITSLEMDQAVSTERVSSGVPGLDAMLGGEGYFRGSSVLVSGTAGTGKTSLAVIFAEAVCRRGERVLYFAFEESPQQVVRNMRSIGVDLTPWVEGGNLKFFAERPHAYGLEMHLAVLLKRTAEFQPQVVIVDPITNFLNLGPAADARAMLTRLVDYLKTRTITVLFTSLTEASGNSETTEVAISSLIDTWLLLRYVESSGERNRAIYLLKSRGMAHSNQIREFRLDSNGIDLIEPYLGADGALTGSARLAHEALERAETERHRRDAERRRRQLGYRRRVIEAQIEALREELKLEEEEARAFEGQEADDNRMMNEDRGKMARSRQAEADGST